DAHQRLVFAERARVLAPARIEVGERGVNPGVVGEDRADLLQDRERAGLVAVLPEPFGELDAEARLAGRDPDERLVLAQHLVVAAGALEEADEPALGVELAGGRRHRLAVVVERLLLVADLLVELGELPPFEVAAPPRRPALLELGDELAQRLPLAEVGDDVIDELAADVVRTRRLRLGVAVDLDRLVVLAERLELDAGAE